MKIVLDTSVLMEKQGIPKEIIEDFDDIIIPYVVLEELDHLNHGRDNERAYKARKAIQFIDNMSDDLHFMGFDDEVLMRDVSLDPNKVDDVIIAIAYDEEARLYSYDLYMNMKAKNLQILLYTNKTLDEPYKGYIILDRTSDENNELLQDLIAEGNLLPNQYIYVKDSDEDKDDPENIGPMLIRWTENGPADTLVSRRIKGKNIQQEMAIDLILNPSIPIKIICGGYGSGKTYLAVKLAEELIEYRRFDKLLLVRNPIPVDDIDIGALPGDKNDKVGSYFKSMTQYLERYSNNIYEEYDPTSEEELKHRGYEIEMEIPSFMKGISVDNTLMIVDECEDLNLKLIKTLGTRIGEGSSIIFTGDYHQAERRYRNDNGISKLIEQCKGNPLVGIVILEEDVRSDVSKIFANLD